MEQTYLAFQVFLRIFRFFIHKLMKVMECGLLFVCSHSPRYLVMMFRRSQLRFMFRYHTLTRLLLFPPEIPGGGFRRRGVRFQVSTTHPSLRNTPPTC
jgi:hypothetical protein